MRKNNNHRIITIVFRIYWAENRPKQMAMAMAMAMAVAMAIATSVVMADVMVAMAMAIFWEQLKQ